MNFHNLFGAMVGERGTGQLGYGYINPYEQASFPHPTANHGHQELIQHHHQQSHQDHQIKTDPYGSLAPHMGGEFFNPQLYPPPPSNHQHRSDHAQSYDELYKYHEKPGLDMRLHERVDTPHHRPVETPHLPHYEDHQSPQLPHHLGAVPPHKQEVVGQPGGGGGGQHPYNQFLPFFPHFLQNFQRQQQQHQQTNGILDHNQSASSKMELVDPRARELDMNLNLNLSAPPASHPTEPPTKPVNKKSARFPKTPKPPKEYKGGMNGELGDGQSEGAGEDTEEVPDHEKVFTENVEEMCQCLCKICNTTMKFRSLREHVRFQHSMNIQMYKEKYGNIYTRLTYHRCKLCDKVIKASYDFLNNHVSKVHKMSFAQYRVRFNIFKGRSKKIFKGENEEHEKVFSDELDKMCLCRCEICKLELEPYNMRHHMKSKHNMALDAYRDQYGEIEFSRETYHKCKLCQKEILFEYQKLSSHLYSGHSLGISKYINLFLSNSENSVENENKEIHHEHECKICGSTFPANKFRYHLQSEHSLNTRRYEETFGHINDFQYKSSDDVADMCTFKCKVCEVILQAQDFSSHVINVHKLNLKVYRKQHGKLTFENKTFHKCKECERDILFTVTAIKRHLDTKHSMTFKKYRAKHSLFADLKETFKTGTRGRKKKTGPKVPVPTGVVKEEPGEKTESQAPLGAKFSNVLADSCKYTCQLCKATMDLFQFKKHLPREHSLTILKYTNEFGELKPVEEIYHKCKLCSSELRFDRETLTQHLKPAHSVSFAQYKNIFAAFEDCKPKLPVPPNQRRSRRSNALSDDLDMDGLDDSPIPVCKYLCKECDGIYNRRQLIKHVTKAHDMSYKQYRDKNGQDVPIEKIYHNCKICSTRLLACYDTIKSHARDKHSITFREYKRMCEELLEAEFKSSDIVGGSSSTLAQALNIKMEPNEGAKALEPDIQIKSEKEDSENEEFDHEDVAYAMSVSLEEKERSSQENSFEKDGEGLEDNKDNKPQEEEEENEDVEEDVEDEEAMEEEEEAVEEVSCKVEQPDYPEEEDEEEMEAE